MCLVPSVLGCERWVAEPPRNPAASFLLAGFSWLKITLMRYIVPVQHFAKVCVAELALSLSCKFAGVLLCVHTDGSVSACMDGKLNLGQLMSIPWSSRAPSLTARTASPGQHTLHVSASVSLV